jgi:hypothetical protein
VTCSAVHRTWKYELDWTGSGQIIVASFTEFANTPLSFRELLDRRISLSFSRNVPHYEASFVRVTGCQNDFTVTNCGIHRLRLLYVVLGPDSLYRKCR